MIIAVRWLGVGMAVSEALTRTAAGVSGFEINLDSHSDMTFQPNTARLDWSPSYLSQRSMSIKSGQYYKITNEENGLVFDQSRYRYKIANETNGLAVEQSGGKNKTVLGYGFEDIDSQRVSRLPLIR